MYLFVDYFIAEYKFVIFKQKLLIVLITTIAKTRRSIIIIIK